MENSNLHLNSERGRPYQYKPTIQTLDELFEQPALSSQRTAFTAQKRPSVLQVIYPPQATTTTSSC